MEGFGIGARIRRKESLAALKDSASQELPDFLGYGKTSSLPGNSDVPPDTNQLQKFKDELLDIDRKKREHLVIPKPAGGGFLNFTTVLIVLLLAVSAALFFAGGYLYSFNSPPAGSNLSLSGGAAMQSKPDWRIGTVVEGSATAAQGGVVPQKYMARRQIIERNEVLAERVNSDVQNRLNLAARQEAKRIAARTTNNIKNSVRSVVGGTIARFFNPVAETVVKRTVGSAIDEVMPAKEEGVGTSSGGVSSDGETLASGGMPSSGATMGEIGELFALELQTFYDTTDAFLFMRQLKEKGYSAAYMVRAQAGKNVVFKVRVGNFATYADANETRKLIGHPSRVVLATRSDDPMGY